MSCCSPAAEGAGRALPVLALTLLLASWPAAAQVPDTVRADTLAVDTVDAYTLHVEGEEDARLHLPVLLRLGRERLLPPHARIILTRDSIEFTPAETVSDLLADVAGVYLWRGGWIGRPEMPQYLARGATAVEYIVEGVPWLPIGPDSVAGDPSLFPLGMLEQIEIERLPGALRVHLLLRRHDLLAPRTRVAVGRGDFNQARYEGLFEKRFRSGVGLSLAAEQVSSDPASGGAGSFRNTNSWLQLDYAGQGKVGGLVRFQGMSLDRAPSDPGGDTTAFGVDGTRRDLTGQLQFRARPDGLGPRLDLVYSRTSWNDSLRQTRWQAGALGALRGETWSFGVRALYGSRWTHFDGQVQGGWSPTELVSLALEAARQEHDSARSSQWVLARAGVNLPLGAALSGAWRSGRQVARPAFPDDSAQSLADREVALTWERSWFGLRGTWSRLGPFQPVPFRQFVIVDSIARAGETEWVTLGARLAPRQWFTLSGWYSNPVRGVVEGTPPTHSVLQAAIRSKFLRTFPSGIFDLKVALTMESWGTGVLGRDGEGNPVQLDGATFFRGLIQMQFGGFVAYIDRTNFSNTRKVYVPGFPIPRNVFTFGVRWTFLN